MADNGCGTARRSRGRYRLTCDVAVDPLQRVGGSKREHAREHLVQGDAQRVEIAASIDRSIHAPGLFRGHVGKGTGNGFRRCRRLALARQPGRDAKAGEPYVAGVASATSTFSGLISLWIRPRWWTWPSAVAKLMARPRRRARSSGAP